MKRFDTKVQYLKYLALREVVRHTYAGTLLENLYSIPKTIIPGNKATMRCCVHKERAILADRVQMAMGGDKSNPNIVEVLENACDGCPSMGHMVTDSCRGCIAHRCAEVCPRKAIYFDNNQHSHIDKDKCIDCGLCAKVCPYNAIQNYKRPCQNACSVGAITINDDKLAAINHEKCVECGHCVYQCPFGAIVDKSYIIDVVNMLKATTSDANAPRVYAAIAPAIASQFHDYTYGQLLRALKQLGFHYVVEVALGGDMVAQEEGKELVEKGMLTTSCCPAFVQFIEKHIPKMLDKVSHTPSPMAMIARYIKRHEPEAKIVFIGPCIAKKREFQRPNVRPYVDCVITFEELQALLDGSGLDMSTIPDMPIHDTASLFGRIFARSGGVSEAVVQAVKESGSDFVVKPVACNGIAECKAALLKASSGRLDGNLIEGMACIDGCISGAGCLTHGPKDKRYVDKFGQQASANSITEAIDNAVNIFKH